MYIDIGKYEASKYYIIDFFNSKAKKDIGYTISMCASITSVPCIAIAYWLGEETNWHPDTLAAIKRLIEFYGYTEIDNKPQGAPK